MFGSWGGKAQDIFISKIYTKPDEAPKCHWDAMQSFTFTCENGSSPTKSSQFHFHTKVTVLWPFCAVLHLILPCSVKKCDIWKGRREWLNWWRLFICFASPPTSVLNETRIWKSHNYCHGPLRSFYFFTISVLCPTELRTIISVILMLCSLLV